MLMLRNVRLIDPASKTDGIRDIIITDRKFLKIGIGLVLDASMLARAKGERLEIIDCRGLVAAPGLIDVHVHMRDPGFTHKESILTAAAAAAGCRARNLAMMPTEADTVESSPTVQLRSRETSSASVMGRLPLGRSTVSCMSSPVMSATGLPRRSSNRARM